MGCHLFDSKRPMNNIFLRRNAVFTFDLKTNQNGSVRRNVQISKGMAWKWPKSKWILQAARHYGSQIRLLKFGYWSGKEKLAARLPAEKVGGFVQISGQQSALSDSCQIIYPNGVKVNYQGKDLAMLSQLIKLYWCSVWVHRTAIFFIRAAVICARHLTGFVAW